MRPAPTQQDVAKLAGVSPRTVSRVVSEDKGFSAATRERVLLAVDQIGYRPNRAARALATGQSSAIGVVGGDLADPVFAEAAAAVGKELSAWVKTMLFVAHDNSAKQQVDALEMLQSDAVHGVILFPTPGGLEGVERLVHAGLRVVLVDAEGQASEIPVVRSTIGKGAGLAVDYLIGTGRGSIAMLVTSDLTSSVSLGRCETGFHHTVSSHLSDDQLLVKHVSPTMDGGYLATQQILAERPCVDGIFANNDMMAVGVLHALSDLGHRVPDDVAVIGYGDLRIAMDTRPALTTVRIDRAAVAAAAVDLLLKPRTVYGQTIEIDTQLIVRESA